MRRGLRSRGRASLGSRRTPLSRRSVPSTGRNTLSRRSVIDALERPRTSGSGWFALLVDPFERFGGPVAAALGVVIALLSAATSYFGRIRYDGFLDIHTQGAAPRALACAVDQFAAFVVPTMIAWAVALAAGRRTRFIDLLGAVGLSRGPYLIAGIVAGAVPVPKGSNGPLTWLVVSVAR